MNFDPAFLDTILLIALAFGAVFLLALWLSLVIWTIRDLRARSRSLLALLLAALLVTVLFLPGLLVYLILRPPRTIEDDYQRALQEEALLQSFTAVESCPGCSRKMAQDWIVCPWCYTRLKKKCPQCASLLHLQWNVCPYCTTPLQGVRRRKQDIDSGQSPPPSEAENPPDEKPPRQSP
jgi:hypothetical protein